jgi:cystathionine beta-lyase/cystathionine gamma-synthase
MPPSHPYGTPRASAPPLGPLSAEVGRATTFGFDSAEALRRRGSGEETGDFYPRYGHRNAWAVEAAIAEREGAEGALVFSSGMAAIAAAILGLCGKGDRVLVAEHIYGGTDAFAERDLPRLGLEVERFDSLAPAALERALRRPARLVVLETPINPTLRLVDLAASAELCRAAGATLMVDGTFAPPPVQRVLECGPDLVMHSLTKFYGGHSDVLGGVIAGPHRLLGAIEGFRRRTGAVLGPDAAWLVVRSLPTHDLRLRAQQDAALAVARALHARVAERGPILSVAYPGLDDHPDAAIRRRQMSGGGSLVTVEVAGGLGGAVAVYDRLRAIVRAPSLGGVETLASLPLHTSHAHVAEEARARRGIRDGMIRLSLGVEGAEAVLTDFLHAVASVPRAVGTGKGGNRAAEPA